MVEWEVPTEGGGEEPPKCPVCDKPVVHFDTTVLDAGGTVGVNHYRCDDGHTDPDKCCEKKDECVLDVYWSEGGGGPPEPCSCPCPYCGECRPVPIGICNEGGMCAEKVKCLRCGEEYVCPVGKGNVCPYCCERGNVVIVDAPGPDGGPIVVGGLRKKLKWCRKCKKGSASLAGTKPPCGELKVKGGRDIDED